MNLLLTPAPSEASASVIGGGEVVVLRGTPQFFDDSFILVQEMSTASKVDKNVCFEFIILYFLQLLREEVYVKCDADT